MGRIILGIVVGYIVTVVIIVSTFNGAYIVMGPDNAFEPGTFKASTQWLVMAVTVSLLTAFIGGATCALVSKKALAVFLLADLILVGGIIMSIGHFMKEVPNEVRSGPVSNYDARTKAISPTWFVIAVPILGFAGVWIGGSLFLRGQHVRESVRIQAPIDKVFALAVDIPNCTQWARSIKRVEMLTDGPVRVGTKWRETRVVMGREETQALEMTDVQTNRQYSIGCNSMGAKFETDMVFTSAGAATDVSLETRIEPQTISGRLMAPFMGLFMGMLRRCLKDDLNDLKSAAEAAR